MAVGICRQAENVFDHRYAKKCMCLSYSYYSCIGSRFELMYVVLQFVVPKQKMDIS